MSAATGAPQYQLRPLPCQLQDLEAARTARVQHYTLEQHHERGLARPTMTCTGSAPTQPGALTASRWCRPPPDQERSHSQVICEKEVVEVLHKGEAALHMSA